MNERTPCRGTLDQRLRVGWGVAAWGLLALNAYEMPSLVSGFCERAVPLALLWLTALSAAGCGGRVLQRLAVFSRGPRRLEQFCVASAVGWAMLSLLLCALALVGQFQVGLFVPLGMLCTMCFGLGLDGRFSGWDLCVELPWRKWIRLYRRDLWTRLAGIVTLVIVGNTFLWAWGPVWDYDSEMYHLPNAMRLLQEQGIVAVADEPLANLPGQAYLWFALALSAGSESYAALLVCWSAVLTSLLAAALASRWLGMHAALWTLPLYWSGLIVQAVASTPRVEPLYSLMFLAAIAVLLEAQQCGQLKWSAVAVSGLCLGTAGAIKYQGLYGWLVIGLWWAGLGCSSPHWRNLRTLLRVTAMFLVGLLVLSPWWGKNLVAFGNPVYPMFDRQRIDPDSLRFANPYGPHQRTHGWLSIASDTWELFTNPNSFSGPPNQWPHYAFLILPLLIVAWPRSRRGGLSAAQSHTTNRPPSRGFARNVVLTLLCLASAYYVLALRLTHESRHLFGVFAIFSMLCGYVVAEFQVRWGLKVVLPALIVLSMAVVPLHPSRLVRLPSYLQYACGWRSAAKLRAQVLPRGFDEALAWCNAQTPRNAVILMCWESRRYRLQRSAITDSGGSTWMTLFRNRSTAAEISAYLGRQGIDFVLVNEAALEFNTTRSRLIPYRVRDDFRRQRAQLVPAVLEPVFESQPHTTKSVIVYRVRKQVPVTAGDQEAAITRPVDGP